MEGIRVKNENTGEGDLSKNPALTRRQQRHRRCLRNLLLVCVCLVSVNAAITSLLMAWRTPDTVSFDMKGTIDRFTEQVGAQNLSEDHARALTTRFSRELDTSIREWQQYHDAVILVTPAVVSGAKDITTDIQRDVAERMAKGD